jgi:hypothetical protein
MIFPAANIFKPLQAKVVAGSDRLSLGDVIIQDCLDLINASQQRHAVALRRQELQGFPVNLPKRSSAGGAGVRIYARNAMECDGMTSALAEWTLRHPQTN